MTLSSSLPLELIQDICKIAAAADRCTAFTLAFVSKAICRATAESRWRVVVIRSVPQYLAFYRELHAVATRPYNSLIDLLGEIDPKFRSLLIDTSDQAELNLTGSSQKHQEETQFTSLPTLIRPHEQLQHLFIDFTQALELHSTLPLYDHKTFESILSNLIRLAISTSLGDSTAAPATLRRAIKRCVADGALMMLSQLKNNYLGDLKGIKLQHLSLGADFIMQMKRGHQHQHWAKEISLVYERIDADALRGIMRDIFRLNNLERLHILGKDASAEISGRETPWRVLQDAISITRGSLTHLRYDTRRFAFKPAEIFASRLRPLLQEATLVRNGQERIALVEDNTYQHEGPRHAAPVRGAGNALHRDVSHLIPVQHLSTRDILAQKLIDLGVGQLDFLQFAWEPMNTQEIQAKDLPLHRRARYSAVDDGDIRSQISNDMGGWPREMRGAWTERSDRDVAPSFSVELRDAVSSLYGWQAPSIIPAFKFAASKEYPSSAIKNVAFSSSRSGEYVDRIQSGMKAEDVDRLQYLTSQLAEQGDLQGLEIPPLQFGVRAPQSLLHFGGKAPYQASERLALFQDRSRGGKGAWPG